MWSSPSPAPRTSTPQADPAPRIVIADSVPLASWRRKLITGNGDGIWTVAGERHGDLPLARCDLATARQRDRRVDAFLFWSRAPYIWRRDGQWMLGDARFIGGLTGFTLPLPPGTCPAG